MTAYPIKISRLPVAQNASDVDVLVLQDGYAKRYPGALFKGETGDAAPASVFVQENFEAVEAAAAAPAAAEAAAASELAAQDFATSASTARADAETANTSATQTAADMQTALANVENYDNTLGLLSPIAKQIVAAADVGDNRPVDTNFDSDGGAWRKKVRWLSVPGQGGLLVRPASLSLVSLDAPSTPTVKTWVTAGAVKAVYRNGFIVYAATGGVYTIDLIRNEVYRNSTAGLAKANQRADEYNQTTATWTVVDAAKAIVSNTVNDCTITVSPGTPIDRERGLPTPVKGLATAGGVSVIHWDGRVCNITGFPGTAANKVFIDSSHLLYVARFGGVDYGAIPQTDQSVSGEWRYSVFLPDAGAPYVNMKDGNAAALSERAIGGSSGLFKHSVPPRLPRSAVTSQITSKYTTGHMIGDTKLALSASAADLTTLVAGNLWSGSDTLGTGWTNNGDGSFTSDGSQTAASKIEDASISIPKPGVYRQVATISAISAGSVGIGYGVGGGAAPASSYGSYVGRSIVGEVSRTFVFTGTGTFIGNVTATEDFVGTVENIRFELLATDRSVAGNHPVIVGSVTREVVAAGADLAAYSGFSASNYLEVPYSSAFDVGTGDICVTTLFKADALGRTLVAFQDPEGTGNGFLVYMQGNGSLTWYKIVNGVNTMLTAAPVGQPNSMDGRWHSYVGFRKSGVVYQYVDGALVSSASDSTDLTNAGRVIRVGAGANGANPFGGKLALTRVSSTAPTPAQIREMARQELALCQPGAKCLLSGSDNVQGLSYDDTTDLLYVAKAAGGTDVFKGLERVGSITMATDPGLTSNDHRGVSAKDDVVSIRTPNEAYASAPAVPLRPKLLGHNGGPPLYDRDEATFEAVTTDATPKVIAKFPLAKGERGVFTITVRASQYADGAAHASYVYRCHAYRPEEGNIALRGAVTETILGESNAAMAAAITANTTTQTLDVTATGLAATNLVWTVEMERA